MKKTITISIIVFVVGLFIPQITQAQGTTYLSNLSKTPTGSMAVGSDSWVAAWFTTGTNTSGYALDSVQLGISNASGNPNGFKVMIYSADENLNPGTNLGTLSGSLTPVIGGVYAYTPATNITLLRYTPYFIVLTAGTVIANGAYNLSLTSPFFNIKNDSWGTFAPGPSDISVSGDGSSWTYNHASIFPQFSIDATVVPEPGILSLFVLGGAGFLWQRRKTGRV